MSHRRTTPATSHFRGPWHATQIGNDRHCTYRWRSSHKFDDFTGFNKLCVADAGLLLLQDWKELASLGAWHTKNLKKVHDLYVGQRLGRVRSGLWRREVRLWSIGMFWGMGFWDSFHAMAILITRKTGFSRWGVCVCHFEGDCKIIKRGILPSLSILIRLQINLEIKSLQIRKTHKSLHNFPKPLPTCLQLQTPETSPRWIRSRPRSRMFSTKTTAQLVRRLTQLEALLRESMANITLV